MLSGRSGMVVDTEDVSLMFTFILQAWFPFIKLNIQEDMGVAVSLSHSTCIVGFILQATTILRLSRPKFPCSQTLVAYNSLKYTAIKVANASKNSQELIAEDIEQIERK